jgi:hypothetical protein
MHDIRQIELQLATKPQHQNAGVGVAAVPAQDHAASWSEYLEATWEVDPDHAVRLGLAAESASRN